MVRPRGPGLGMRRAPSERPPGPRVVAGELGLFRHPFPRRQQPLTTLPAGPVSRPLRVPAGRQAAAPDPPGSGPSPAPLQQRPRPGPCPWPRWQHGPPRGRGGAGRRGTGASIEISLPDPSPGCSFGAKAAASCPQHPRAVVSLGSPAPPGACFYRQLGKARRLPPRVGVSPARSGIPGLGQAVAVAGPRRGGRSFPLFLRFC